VVAALYADGKLPDGWQLHLAGPIENGWRVVSVEVTFSPVYGRSGTELDPAVKAVLGRLPNGCAGLAPASGSTLAG
jgi:hypothetical protein